MSDFGFGSLREFRPRCRAFADADTSLEELEQELTGEAKDQIKRFDLGGDEDDDI